MRFSSTGLAFDGRVKPEVVAPGVALETAEPGANTDGSARYGTVNGTSGAAALVAGAAALLAQARPYLDADALKSLIVGAARPLPDDPVTAQGVGLIDLGGATATEVGASPASLALGRADTQTLAHGPGIRPAQRFLPPADSVARGTRRPGGRGWAPVRPQAAARVARAGKIDPGPCARTTDEQTRGDRTRRRRRDRDARGRPRNSRAVGDHFRETPATGPRLRSSSRPHAFSPFRCRAVLAELRRGLGSAFGRRARRASALPPGSRAVEQGRRPHRAARAPTRRAAGPLFVRRDRSRPDRRRASERRIPAQAGRVRRPTRGRRPPGRSASRSSRLRRPDRAQKRCHLLGKRS